MTLDTKHLRALRAAATQGEWVHVFSGDIRVGRPHGMPTHAPRTFADYELIVAAVNALPALCDAAEERDRLRAEREAAVTRVAELEARLSAAEAWDDAAPRPEDADIAAAHPTRTGNHARYAEAMRLVGPRRSKSSLVSLVNWLLTERDEWRELADRCEEVTALHERAEKAEAEVERLREERFVAAAWVLDRAEQYEGSSPVRAAFDDIMKGLADGEHLAAAKHGELGDALQAAFIIIARAALKGGG